MCIVILSIIIILVQILIKVEFHNLVFLLLLIFLLYAAKYTPLRIDKQKLPIHEFTFTIIKVNGEQPICNITVV